MFDVLILPFALVLFGVLAYRRISAIILGPLVTMVVIILARLPMLETMLGPYMEAASGYVKKFFLVFFVGALFGAVMEETRAAESIAKALVKLTKGKWAASVIMIITGILTYGGVSGFVVFFAMYPIALELFRSTNISRRLIPAAISAGTWTWSMNGPGTPAIQNIIPMRYLGTSSVAAPIPGAAGGLAQLILIVLYLEWRAKWYKNNGFLFDDPNLPPIKEFQKDEGGPELPNPWISFIPSAVILILFNIFHMAVEGAVLFGIISAIVLLYKQLNINEWIKTLNKGAANSATAILNTAIVVGFAGAVRTTEGFAKIIASLKSWRMSPLLFVAITSAIAAGAAGSASGGLGIAYESLKDVYLNLGIPLEYIHRVSVIAAGTFDTLPHQGAQITLLAICGLSHKEGYFDIAVTQLLIPIVVLLAVVIPLCSMGL